ncbi:MAG: protein kinase [Kineosporiaceae bacterium]|nr:protein kinase [Aeromicrobium sp.]
MAIWSPTPADRLALSTTMPGEWAWLFPALETRTMETVGGYRLVRKLGAGERAEIHLGHAGSSQPPTGDRIAAIKIFRPSTDDASVDREIEALARASSRHLLELKDLATGRDGRPCLILPRLGSGNLGRLLAVRDDLQAGEAVSILVPLVEAVQELHRVGVAHGAVAPASVLFDDGGAPVLARFGEVSLIGDFPTTDCGQSLTWAFLDEEQRAIDDRAGLRDLVGTVLDRLSGGANPRSLATLRDCVDGPPPTDRELARLIDLLFDLAPALSIRFDNQAPREESESLSSNRVDWHPDSPGDELEQNAVLQPGVLPTVSGSAIPVSSLSVPSSPLPLQARSIILSDRQEHPLAKLGSRIVAILAPVRTPIWIAGGAGLGALVVALTVIPTAHPETATEPFASASPSVTRIAKASGSAADIAPTKRAATDSGAASAIEGEDPLAAARALLAARTQCFIAQSLTCFTTVDQAGSAVIEADRDLVRRLKKGQPLPAEATLDGFTPRLIQQLGDSAIIQLIAADGSAITEKNPAPLLLVRNEAGWRIRDLALG